MLGTVRAVLTRERIAPILLGAALGIVVLIGVLIFRSSNDTVVIQGADNPDPMQIQVWVSGEVASPGLYSLARGSRVANALEAAGGALDNADLDALNMARIVNDAEQIQVPETTRSSSQDVDSEPAGNSKPAKVNINLADQELLQSLPGIGPVLAERIIAYRKDHGSFQVVDDLAGVQGISELTIAEFRDLITTGF